MSCRIEFTEAENKIRKTWLWLHVIIPVVSLVIILLPITVFLSLMGNNLGALAISVEGILSAGAVCLGYYCAYKKPGTVLLIVDMSCRAFCMIVFMSISIVKGSVIFLLFSLLFVTFQLFCLYYSNELHKMNAKMQKIYLKSSPIYQKSLEVFSAATNMDELNDLYSQLKPHSKSWGLSEAYRQHKRKLSLQTLNLQ